MQCIYQCSKFLRISETGSRRKKTGTLISPTSVEWMFHYGHQFNVGKAHIQYIRNQAVSYLLIGIIHFFVVGIWPHPTGQMHFIHRIRCLYIVVLFSGFHPFGIPPFILRIPNDGSRIRSFFPVISKGVSLI